MGILHQQAIRAKSLAGAWDDVLANDADDGVLSPAIQRFNEQAEVKLAELHQSGAGSARGVAAARAGELTAASGWSEEGRLGVLLKLAGKADGCAVHLTR